MPVEIITAPGTRLFERAYLGEIDQPRRVRADLATFAADCPGADDLVLLASELSANAVQHSLSGESDGEFTVRAEIRPGNYVWLEVEDQGGEWSAGDHDDEHGRGLAIVAAIAGDGNWGVESGNMRGPHVVWARLDWQGSSELPAEESLKLGRVRRGRPAKTRPPSHARRCWSGSSGRSMLTGSCRPNDAPNWSGAPRDAMRRSSAPRRHKQGLRCALAEHKDNEERDEGTASRITVTAVACGVKVGFAEGDAGPKPKPAYLRRCGGRGPVHWPPNGGHGIAEEVGFLIAELLGDYFS